MFDAVRLTAELKSYREWRVGWLKVPRIVSIGCSRGSQTNPETKPYHPSHPKHLQTTRRVRTTSFILPPSAITPTRVPATSGSRRRCNGRQPPPSCSAGDLSPTLPHPLAAPSTHRRTPASRCPLLYSKAFFDCSLVSRSKNGRSVACHHQVVMGAEGPRQCARRPGRL